MEGHVATLAPSDPALEIIAADRQRMPLVLASPHSGTTYPPDLLAASRLDPLS
jgi:N-formylglutamate amidohydrolase